MPESWERRGDPKPAMAGRPLYIAPLDSCTLCGLASKGHGKRYGLGHFGDPRKSFVPPSDELRAARETVRHELSTGLPYGGFRPDGERATHLVEARCRCGATVMATPEQARAARCSKCLHDDIKEKGTSRA